MIVDLASYIKYMVLVYGALILLLFGMPLIMWKNYLAKKSFSERFLFCLITQTAFIVNLVLLLGWLDICNPLTLTLGLAGEFLLVRWTYSDKQFLKRRKQDILLIRSAFRRENSWHYVMRVLRAQVVNVFRRIRWGAFADVLKQHWFEILFLLALSAYNFYFLSHNLYTYHSYQFSDTPVHLSWIYELEHGTLFSAGIYPFHMHCMIYAVRVLSGIPLREVVLYYGSFQSVMMLLSLFILAKKLFAWKYTPYFACLLFSLLFNQGRYGASLPQECGMFAFMGMAYYLIRYLEADREKKLVQGDSKLRSIFRINHYLSRKSLNYDFWMLAICVSLVIGFHFYTAIAAILLAVAIVLVHGHHFFRKQYFVPVVCAALTGALIAVLPFGACLARGIPFQESMAWAMSLIDGTEWHGTGYGYLESLTEGDDSYDGSTGEAVPADPDSGPKSVLDRGLTAGEIFREYLTTMVGFSDQYVLGSRVTPFVILSAAIAAAASVFFLIFRRTRKLARNYLSVLVYVWFIMTMGCFQPLGLITIFESTRAAVFAEPHFFLLLAIPMDTAFAALASWKNRIYQRILAAASVAVYAAVGVVMVLNGFYHNYFDVNFLYYNEPDYLIYQIQEEYPDYEYTVVSPTEEYYAVVEHGYHTELSEFVAMVDGSYRMYKFPTPYVFFFVEKYTLQDYFNGPSYVSPEFARADFQYRANTQDYYYQRNTIQSRAYYWAEAFMDMYPNQMKVYFENDIYICYVLIQDPNSPFDLRIDYLSTLEERK